MAGGGKGGGSYNQPSGQTTTTATQQPWTAQQPYLENAFQVANNLFQGGGPQYFPGTTYAPATGAQGEGIQDLWNQGAILNSQALTPLQAMNSLLSGQSVQNNPAAGVLANVGSQNLGQNNAGVAPLTSLAQGNTGYDTGSAYGGLYQLGGQNMALGNPAYGSLAQIANQGAGGLQGPSNVLGALSGTNAATQNAAGGILQGVASPGGTGLSQPIGALQGIAGPGGTGLSQNIGALQNIAGPGGTGLSGALGALGSYSSGSQINPFLDQLSQSTLAGVLPSIQKQFIEGGSLSSPQAAYASSQGATAALAPVLNQAFQQEQQNQINAANMEGNLRLGRGQLQTQAEQAAANARLGRAGVQTTAANDVANAMLGRAGVQTTAASDLGNQFLTGAGQQANAAGLLGNLGLGNAAAQNQAGATLGNQLLTGSGQQAGALSSALSGATGLGNLQAGAASNLGNLGVSGQNAQTNALSALGNTYGQGVDQIIKALGLYPQTAAGTLTGAQAVTSAGQQQQALSQNAINDQLQRWNYQQTSPFNNLNQFLGQVSGNYGGTATQSNPYYMNQGANALGGALGGAALGSTILGPSGLGLLGSGTAAAGGAGLGALLAFL